MKNLLIFTFLFSSISTFAQKLPEHCNQLPYAKVEKKASLKKDLESIMKKDLPADMKTGEFIATFKTYISCEGELVKQMFTDGNMTEDQQSWVAKFLDDSKWNAAIKDDTFVTSTVFIKVEIINSQVKISIL